ncbi:methylated-DNA--[protein]-cysteine S-methyltransferase [Emcibacter sp.]|uniref:methylated-DNA--[protein]-cysteine S-methyltransferase n=1 Tax=Emcibacter sp. TaxID=1979954 RepID=UPI002AA8630B|nr:methylated-DNA--[protein]-cysteine S-methyltransferase [Emcibacter sp.]
MTQLTIDHIKSPVGIIFAISNRDKLCALDFEEFEDRMHRLLAKRHDSYDLTEQKNTFLRDRLDRYFSGNMDSFNDIEVEISGTPFQSRVWQALRTIPAGETWSYKDLAAAVGNPKAVRAVGTANGQNPVAIIIPCHRVIGSDGGLAGYAGGIERKRRLLELEGISFPEK